jgi:hypothetical protein
MVLESLAFQQFHDNERPVLLLADIENRADPGEWYDACYYPGGPVKSCLNLIFVLLIASVAFPQNPIKIPVLQDDLLDHLVGKWDMRATVHGRPSKETFEADWVLNHQFVRIYEKSEEGFAGTNIPFEALHFIGYDKFGKRYVFHFMDVDGGSPNGAFMYGQRSGNEIKFEVLIEGRLPGHIQFIWQPESRTWHYAAGPGNAVTVDLTSMPAGKKEPSK